MEIWHMVRGGKRWAKRQLTEEVAKKPLVNALRYALKHRPRGGKEFWLVFDAAEVERFKEAGQLLVDADRAASVFLDAAIHIFSKTWLGPISSTLVPSNPNLPFGEWAPKNTHLAIRFGE